MNANIYSDSNLPIRETISSSHTAAINSYHQCGTWLTAATRRKILDEYRFASTSACQLCNKRKSALSPFAHSGDHQKATNLPDNIVEVVHRITTDSGRLTEKWFTKLLDEGLLAEEYIEVLGCVATAIILDSFALGIGAAFLEPEAEMSDSEPSRQKNTDVIEEAAWVPLSIRDYEMGASGLPTVPNIARAMGLVPAAIDQFFPVMRSHYGLTVLNSELNRSQTELIAARTSSYNDCFY